MNGRFTETYVIGYILIAGVIRGGGLAMKMKLSEAVQQLNRLTYSLTLVGHKVYEPEWEHPPRQNPYHTMWMITKGRGRFHIDGISHTAEAGKLFILRPGTPYERSNSSNQSLEYYIIRFNCTTVFEESEEWHYAPPQDTRFPLEGAFIMENPPGVINLCQQLHHFWKQRGQIVSMRRKILLQELLLAVVQDLRNQRQSGSSTLSIEKTVDYMVHQYAENITLEQLSNQAGMSTSHYSHLFKKYIGYSPIDYLTHLRIDRAKELLVLSDYRLKYVAQSVGYQDEFYFSRIFKKIVGTSPSDYMKKHRPIKFLPLP